MPKIAIELDTKQIESIIRQMNPDDQKKIERRLWATRMDTIVAKMRKNVRKNKITKKF